MTKKKQFLGPEDYMHLIECFNLKFAIIGEIANVDYLYNPQQFCNTPNKGLEFFQNKKNTYNYGSWIPNNGH